MQNNVTIKLTIVILAIVVLIDCTDAVPPEYKFRRYTYRKKSRSVWFSPC